MALVGQDQRQRLAERRRDARRAEPGAHHLMHQRPRLFVRQRLDGLGETGRDLARDATAVLGIGEPRAAARRAVPRRLVAMTSRDRK